MWTICAGISLLFKTILPALLVAVPAPDLYFASRMEEPLPEFKGLSNYQDLARRKMSPV